MPQAIHRNQTSFDVGQQQYVIDGLPNDSVGFRLDIGQPASWESMVGRIFTLTIEIDLTGGGVWHHWITAYRDGGVVLRPDGTPTSALTVVGYWPGENDGSGGRRVLRAANLRATVDVAQAFTAPSVDLIVL